MATTTKVIVQLHERTTLVAMDSDLQLRELGFISDTNSFRFNENGGTKHTIWMQDGTTPLYENTLQLVSGVIMTGASSSFELNALVADYSSGVSRIAAARAGANEGQLALYTTDSAGSTTEKVRIDGDGLLGIGDPSPDGKLSLKGGDFQLKDSAVAHGLISVLPTDVYGSLSINHSLYGGLKITGVSDDDDPGLYFQTYSYGGEGQNGFYFNSSSHDLADTVSNFGSSDYMFKVANNGTRKFVIKGDGSVGINRTSASYTLHVNGTCSISGVSIFTAQPIFSSLTASQAVFTDGSKGLVSNAITGTGNVVMSASPTLTGTTLTEIVEATYNNTSPLPTGAVAYTDSQLIVGNLDGSATFSGIGFRTRTSAASNGMIALEYQGANVGDFIFNLRDGSGTSGVKARISSTGNIDAASLTLSDSINIGSGKFTVDGLYGDTQTGNLDINRASPNLQFYTSGVYHSRFYVANDNNYFSSVLGDLTLEPAGVIEARSDFSLYNNTDLLGSNSSDIDFGSGNFTVSGSTGNTTVGGTFTVAATKETFLNLPTSAGTAGSLWNDAGTVKVA